MFDSDPIAERRKGWVPRPSGGVKLVRAWQPPEMGMGQDGQESVGLPAPGPPARDDWRLPAPSVGLDSSTGTEYPTQTAPSTLPPAPPKPAVASPNVDVPGVVGAPTPRVPTSRPAGGADGGTNPQTWDEIVPNQFGDAQLSSAEAQAACGPAAAVAFARAQGRNPTLREATDLAKQFGWSPDSGMRGPQSEVSLMRKMGIDARTGLADHTSLVNAVNGRNPVSLSTPLHYFVLDGYDPSTTKFHVGNSGTAFKAGAKWMTLGQIESIGGSIQAAIYADTPLNDSPGIVPQGSRGEPDPPRGAHPAEVWRGVSQSTPQSTPASAPDDVNPASVWQSDWSQQAEINPADVWGKLGMGSGADIDPATGELLPDTTDATDPQPQPYEPVTPWEKHLAQSQVGTSSDELTNPIRDQPYEPNLPRITPAPDQPPQPTVFDVPIIKDPAAAVPPIKMAQPDQGRPLDPHKYQGQEGAPDFGLPDQADPNADLTPIARATAGLSTNPFELHGQLQDVATHAVVPQQVRDAPVIGGLIEQALDPGWMVGGPESAVADLALKGAGKVAGAAIKAGARAVADTARGWEYVMPPAHVITDTIMSPVAKAGADAILRGLDRIQPGLGRAVASQLPASVATDFAASLGGGAAAAGTTAYLTPEDDPNRWAKIIGAAGVGAAGAFTAIHVYPLAIKTANDIFADAKNLPPHMQAIVAQLAYQSEGGRVAGDMAEQRIIEVLGDRPKTWKPWEWGFAQRGTGLDKWTSADLFERTKQLVTSPTPAQRDLADYMHHFGEMTRKEGKRLGIIKGDVTARPGVEAYFPHLYREFWDDTKKVATKRGLNPHDSFTDFREHDTLSAGLAAGFHPVDSVSEAWGNYVRRFYSSKAKRQFALSLRKLGGPDVIRRTSGKRPGAPSDWVSGREFSIPGLEQFHVSPDMAKVLRNIENPSSLRNSPVLGGIMHAQGEFKKALFAPSAFHLTHELHQVINAQGAAGVPVFAKSLYYNVNPWAFRKFMLTNASEFERAANAGVTMMRHHTEAPDIGAFGVQNPLGAAALRGASSGALTGGGAYLQAKANLEDDQTAIERGLKFGAAGAVLGVAGGPISQGLWERAVPTMKLLTWQTMAARYGDEPAAEFVNEVFGGQNLEAIARSKTIQDAMRLTLLAPDWQEGWIRQIGNGLRGAAAIPIVSAQGKNPFAMKGTSDALGAANAWYWTNAVLTGGFFLEGLNFAFNGHFTNDNSEGHKLALELTGLYDKMGWKHVDDKGRPYRVYQDILGPYRGLLEAPFDPGKFAQARVGLGPSALEEIVSGKDYTGKDIVPPGEDPLKNAGLRFMHAASRLAPVSGAALVQNVGKEPWPVTATSTALGWRTSRVSPIAEQLRARDKAYQEAGLSTQRIAQANETYTNKLAQADRQFQVAINRKNKTHQEIDTELAKIRHPDRASEMAAALPTSLANTEHEAQIKAITQKYASFGTASSQYPADIQPENMIDVDSLAARYENPKPGIDALPKAQQDSIRAKELASMANEYDVEINALRDAIKAKQRGVDMPPVPGVSAAAIDEWVTRWKGKTNEDPMVQSADRRAEIDSIAKQYFPDDPRHGADTVWARIKLRLIPPNKPGELEQSRDKALDILYAAHDPQNFPKYTKNGQPLGGPEQWKSFDAQIAAASTRERRIPEIAALIEARDAAASIQRKYILNNPDYEQYQRWFGVGRGMNEAQWAKYQKGEYSHYGDTKDPAETLNRDRIAEQYKASTPAERRTQQVRILIDGKPQTVNLEAARRHLQFHLQKGWSKALGLDTTGTPDSQSGG